MTDRYSAEDLPIIDDLGAWLRREREQAGVALETIAARTKVARTLLDWQPAVSLEEGLSRTITYFRRELQSEIRTDALAATTP